MPIFDLIEKVMVKRFKFPLGVALRLVVRSTYVGEIFKTIYVFFFFWFKATSIFHLRQSYLSWIKLL